VFALLPCLLGCYEQRVVKDSFEDLRSISEAQQAKSKRPTEIDNRPRVRQRWAIEVASFTGEDRDDDAKKFLASARRKEGLTDLHLSHEIDRVIVYRGMYTDPMSTIAQRDLQHTQGLTIAGRKLDQAAMTPLGAGPIRADQQDSLDLRRYAGMDLFSLQVAVFDANAGPQYREAAEKYAVQLREAGEEAYYYHGPHRSMVTIGVFTHDDFTRTGGYGPRIRTIQQRHEHHIINGTTVYQKQGEQKVLQETFVVRII